MLIPPPHLKGWDRIYVAILAVLREERFPPVPDKQALQRASEVFAGRLLWPSNDRTDLRRTVNKVPYQLTYSKLKSGESANEWDPVRAVRP